MCTASPILQIIMEAWEVQGNTRKPAVQFHCLVQVCFRDNIIYSMGEEKFNTQDTNYLHVRIAKTNKYSILEMNYLPIIVTHINQHIS
jgi:hypothetical protein